MSGPGRRALRSLSELYNTRSGAQAAGGSAPPQGTRRRVRRRSRAPPPPPDPSERLEEQVDEQAHQGGDEHAQAHQGGDEADEEDEQARQGEDEADEEDEQARQGEDEQVLARQGEDEADEEDEQEDEAGGSETSSGVYQRGPASLPDRPPAALRPVIRPIGQQYVTYTFFCYYV